MRPTTTYLTKAQATMILKRVSQDPGLELSKKVGERIMVCHPRTGEPFQCDLQEFVKTDKFSDSKERLWAFIQSSREGRLFEETVQESHVVAYKNDCLEKQRQANLKKHAMCL